MSLTYLKHLCWLIYRDSSILAICHRCGCKLTAVVRACFCVSVRKDSSQNTGRLASVYNNTGPVYLSFYSWEDWGERGEKKDEWGWRTATQSRKWESERTWGEGAMKLVTAVPVTCQQLVLAARAGKACMRSVCMYTCVWVMGLVSLCVCMWQCGPSECFFLIPYWTGRAESCARFRLVPH